MNSPFSLEGKKLLITGASSGIGRAVAIEASRLGASCFLTGRNISSLEATKHMSDNYSLSEIFPCDLTQQEQLYNLVVNLPDLDGVVLNAGINNSKLLQFLSEKDLNDIFEVNCFSPILLTRQLLKQKKIRKGASIVFTSSISGLTNVSIGNGVYGASKSALTAFMKYMALELAPKNIRCNSVHPGRIETPLIQKIALDPKTLERDKATYPLKRYGKPEEVAYAIIYLLSDASSWVTGTSLIIDGGRSLM